MSPQHGPEEPLVGGRQGQSRGRVAAGASGQKDPSAGRAQPWGAAWGCAVSLDGSRESLQGSEAGPPLVQAWSSLAPVWGWRWACVSKPESGPGVRRALPMTGDCPRSPSPALLR